ncbi:lysine-rich arabinogalactan protein 19 [Austrofundulus limnaeus]|uniref:Lysine-rich arabinogalactan protein 19 n=1 Tax=Austrofundulus limnaeus TaxID=52670 RepID=A0A2I4D0Y6_AUSLI|nr:PREDICTED: lysine-rich arabinogalactan protein 19-like [Austrofundulus limnaeus]
MGGHVKGVSTKQCRWQYISWLPNHYEGWPFYKAVFPKVGVGIQSGVPKLQAQPSKNWHPAPMIQLQPTHQTTSASVFSGDDTAPTPAGSMPAPTAPPSGSQVVSPPVVSVPSLSLPSSSQPSHVDPVVQPQASQPHPSPPFIHPFIPLSLFLLSHLFLKPFPLPSPFLASTFKLIIHLLHPYLYHL